MDLVRSIVLASAFALSPVPMVLAQDFEKGLSAYNNFDYATSVTEFMPLAERGNVQAQKYLGTIFQWGFGGLKDLHKAAAWYQLAAEQGDAEAQSNIGFMYFYGLGVRQDGTTAVSWYKLPAEKGFESAQFSLGYAYQEGIGVLQDNVRAHMWYNISATNGGWSGAQNRGVIAKRMTNEDISEAQAMARECMSSGYRSCGW